MRIRLGIITNGERLKILTIKRLLTFGACVVFLSFLLIFNLIVGSVLGGMGGNDSGIEIWHILIVSIGLAVLFSGILVFGNVFPWCRKKQHAGNKIINRVCGVFAVLLMGISLYLYLSITILDKAPRKIQLVKEGMTREQVVELIGHPDWEELGKLWAYRVRGDGIGGILVPYYLTFDGNGLLESVHS